MGNVFAHTHHIYQLVIGSLLEDAFHLDEPQPDPTVVASMTADPPNRNLWINSIAQLAPHENELVRILRAHPGLIPPMDAELAQFLKRDPRSAWVLASARIRKGPRAL